MWEGKRVLNQSSLYIEHLYIEYLYVQQLYLKYFEQITNCILQFCTLND